MATNLEELELIEINKLRRNIEIIKGLPHLHGQKMYPWQRIIFESRNRLLFCTAANQVGKSSILIKKCIHWATSPDLWPSLWNTTPRQFWYLYPDYGTATREFETKWEPEFLPRGKFKDDPQYGWHAEFEKKEIKAIRFNTGITVYFLAYAQMARMMQASTVHATFCFTAGHKVTTKTGQRDIKDIEIGEYVLGMSGEWNRVERKLSRKEKTYRATLSNGTELEATAEHPFWTKQSGWKNFQNLTTEDTLATLPLWQRLKLLFLVARSSIATRIINTHNQETITGTGLTAPFTLRFGGRLTTREMCQKAASYITQILTRLITPLRILFASPRPSTQESTSSTSGRTSALGTQCGPISVSGATKDLNPERPRARSQGFAPKNAGGLGREPRKDAGSAKKNSFNVGAKKLFTAEKSAQERAEKGAALKGAVSTAEKLCLWFLTVTKRSAVVLHAPRPTGTYKEVYNLGVSGDHTYYVNNVATHNCDEEINDTLFPELRFRLMAVQGYFHAAFTATLGQEFWRAIMEDRGPGELFPDALKMQIDLEKDCRFFEDGTPSHWTDEAVREAIAACPTEAEVLRRIRGRFVVTQGRRYPSFSQARNVRPPETEGAPPDWLIFAGVDLGSGSDRGHPSAITFVAVRPDFSFGRVFKHWNGRGVSTTASDVFQKFLEMRGKMRCVHQCYDYSAKDFGTIAQRAGEAFSQAKKDRQLGDNILNSLFRNQMLVIDDIPENYPLIKELERANENDRKTMAHDDSCDSARYCVAPISWDWCFLNPELNTPPPEKQILTPEQERRKFALVGKKTDDEDEPFMRGMNEEISFWQDYLDA